MMKQATGKGTGPRVVRRRTNAVTQESRRVQVSVPARDAMLVKAVAGVLRAGGAKAERVRDAILPIAPVRQARTGTELVTFLRASPLVGEELVIERERSR